MVSEEKAKKLIKILVYKGCDNLGYGKKSKDLAVCFMK